MADRTPAVASGQRTTVAGVSSSRLKVDMSDTIFNYEAEGAPLYTTLVMLAKEDAINKTVGWMTDELVPKFMRINGGTLDNSGVTFTVDSPEGSYVNAGTLIQNTRTGETFMTTTGGSATSVVVTARSWGNVAATANADNDELLILATGYAEGASLAAAITTTEVAYTNTLQTIRNNWSIGGLYQELSDRGGTYGGSDSTTQRQKMVSSHKRALELTLLFSEQGTSGGTTTTYGFIPWLQRYGTGQLNTAATVTEAVFEAGNATWFRGGESQSRVLMMARPVHGIANQFAASVQRTQSGQKMYGLRLTDYTSAHGDIALIRNVHLEGDVYSKYALGFDPSQVKLKVGRDTRIIKNRQGTSTDGYEEEIVSDIAPVFGAPESLYLWENWAA